MKYIRMCLLLLAFGFSFNLQAQTAIWNSNSFAFSRDTSSLMNMNGATSVNFSGAYGNTTLLDFPLGFQFRYGVTNYSRFAISAYGYIKLGGNITTVNPTLQDSIISALYCFNNTYSCSYKLTGMAPNRILVIEWAGNYNFVGAIKYQLWLSERIGRIEFLYETGLKSYSLGNGYAIYCKSKIFNQSVVASLKSKPLKQLPVVNYLAIESNNYDSIGAKTRYIFQPDTIKPVEPALRFSNILPGCLDVLIKDSSINESVFRVERKDVNVYNFLTQFLSASTSNKDTFYTYNDSRLQPDSDYSYRAFASNGFINSDTVVQLIHTPMPLIVGTVKIPGDYPTVNTLLRDAACKHLGPELVIELQPSYDFSAEGAPVYFYPFLQTRVLRHVTIRPAAGASLTLSASFANPLVLVDSVRNIEIDGRAGGTGQTNQLTFRQLNNQWPVISYVRFADSGIVRYCNIEGNIQNGSYGLVYLGSLNPPYYTFLTRGVSGNTISNCKIGPQTGFALKGVVVESSQRGEGITIRNNEIFRFYNEAVDYRYGGKNSRVTSNRIYQPEPVNFISNTPQAIAAMNFTDVEDGCRVDSNRFGGSSPVWGTGNWYQSNFSPTNEYSLIAFNSNPYNGAVGTIAQNQIANISVAGFNYPLKDILVKHGAVVIDGNRIGTADSVNSITNDGSHYAIAVNSNGTKTIKNNFISSTQANGELELILASNTDSVVITGNDIGGSDNYNANGGGGIVRGIELLAVRNAIIKNNTIRGLSSKAKGVWGLSEEWEGVTPTVKNMIFDSNTIHHLEGRMTVYGAYATLEATQSSSFSNNHIYALRGIGPANSPGANQPAIMLGISVSETLFPNAVDTSTVKISGNFIHSLDYVTPSSYYTYTMTGIGASGRRLQINNNMIALGVGKNGLPTDSLELDPTGINFSAAIKSEVEHNSIYIGGSGSYALGILVPASTAANKNVFLSNNIIQIDRFKVSNSMDYQYIAASGSTSSFTNIVSNYNIWYSRNDTSVATKLKNWKLRCHCDTASFMADPLFINPAGDSATQNLHLANGSPADGSGTLSFSPVPYDIDHELRAAYSPVDIGADAINPCSSLGASLQLSPSQDSVSACSGGASLIATSTGSISSLQWQMNLQDISGATAANYVATKTGWYRITGKTPCGTISSKSVYISIESSGPQVKIVPKDTTICLGNSVSFSATGAISYAWTGMQVNASTSSITVQPSSAGNYTYQVMGTANGCSSIDSVKLTVVGQPVLTITPYDTSICGGSFVIFTASGADSYSWSPSTGLTSTSASQVTAQPSSTTTYTVTGKNSAGCATVQTRTVTVRPSVTPSVTIASGACSSGSISFTASAINGGTTPQYQWYVNNSPAGTGDQLTISDVSTATYVYVKLTSNAPCANPQVVSSTTDTAICVATAINDVDGVESFSISPNPAFSYLLVKIKLTQIKKIGVTIEDIYGNKVYASEAVLTNTAYSKNIDISRLTAGNYYLTVVIGSGRITRKIIVVR